MEPELRRKLEELPKGLWTRFAPSPTGYLHLGHLASAIYVWGLARLSGAKVLLRIEDHDRLRSRSDYEASIREDLAWLGFHPDRGAGEATQASDFRQSDHPERYETALASLGRAVYACRCTRREIQERNPQNQAEELHYDGFCRGRAEGPTRRVQLAEKTLTIDDLWLGPLTQTPSAQCGDLLALDRDGFWTYNFAVTVDDIHDDIGLIIRGQDLVHATGRQWQLRELLGQPTKPFVLHHPLIFEEPGRKLSKRDGSRALRTWREEGRKPEDLIGHAAHAVGLIPSPRPIAADAVEELFR